MERERNPETLAYVSLHPGYVLSPKSKIENPKFF